MMSMSNMNAHNVLENQGVTMCTFAWPSMVMAMSMTKPFRAPCTSPTTEAADLELPTSMSTSK